MDTFLWANGPIRADLKHGHKFFYEAPFNCGQHIAHNSMLDQAMKGDYDWHIRVDDDCFLNNRNWLGWLITLQGYILMQTGRYAILSPTIEGLNDPPETIGNAFVKGDRIDQVSVLGGIFRMSPMGFCRYFRWDERLPMGWGEAAQFAKFCVERSIPMFRSRKITATHGDSTTRQQVRDADWSYEHDMLQLTPFGL